MKLYYSPQASSLAPHIAFREIGVEVELVFVDTVHKQTANGLDFTTLNPLGTVPVLELDDGMTLRETAVLLKYASDLKPSAALSPTPNTIAYLRLEEWLNFLASDMHQGIRYLAHMSDVGVANQIRVKLLKCLSFMDVQLSLRPYLTDHGYSIADIYLWVIVGWVRTLPVEREPTLDVGVFENIQRWYEDIAARDAVRSAMKAEHEQITQITTWLV